MLIAQITDTHVKLPGKLAYDKVDTAAMLRRCVAHLLGLPQQPDLILLTGDLVDRGLPEEYAHLKSILGPLPQPLVAVPGNHDARDAMRAAFADGGYLPGSGFLQFAVDQRFALRIIGLDTVIEGEGGGELCRERLAWLDAALHRKPGVPTLIMMHHPPFETGIGHMDRIGLRNSAEFATIAARHPQIKAILCGHLHRPIFTSVGRRPVMTGPSPAHQVALDIDPSAPSCFRMEPPGILLHWWNHDRLVTHLVPIGNYDGPYPFFDASGALID